MSQRNPIVLVHGMWDTESVFEKLKPYLQSRGHDVYSFDMLPSNGAAPLEVLAAQLANYIDRTFGRDPAIDLLGFSMGGIVSRYYLQRLGGLDRTQRFVTVSSPHNGTTMAELAFLPGAKQMRVGSLFLQDLNRDLDRLATLQFTSIWTPLDAIIVPAASSQLSVATNQKVLVPWHKLMVYDRRSLAAIGQALEKPLKPSGNQPCESPISA
jgi:triacylglycerol lipase